MQKFIASTPNAEVLGESILGYLNCVQYAEIEPILSKYGLHNIQAQGWYPHQMMLNVLRDIESGTYNVTESMVCIGIRIMELATVPESIDCVEAALDSLHAVYHLHHRNITEIGWSASLLGSGHMRVTPANPYPDDQSYGIVWGAVKRFKPLGATFKVVPVKDENAETTSFYDVIWGV